MRNLKSVFGIAGAVVPILYCGGLLYYFLDLSGSMREASEIGLGPTVLGLGAVSLLFSIPLIIKVVRLFARPRTPGSGGGSDKPDEDDKNGFDADAAIARYLASRSQEVVPSAPPTPPARKIGAAPIVTRPGFGRRVS